MTRRGRQTPTKSVIKPYTRTKGTQAVKLYSLIGKSAQEWQQLLVYDIMAVGDDGLWVHNEFGYSVPRRNGKTEVVYMRELWGLFKGEHIMHTAHHTSTTHASWEVLTSWLDKIDIEYKSIKAKGQEVIFIPATGGKIEYRTRTAKTGLGEAYDLLVIDEAQEYTTSQESAIKYTISSSKNPQCIMLGTPPTMYSSGDVFEKYRTDTLSGEKDGAGWAEWGNYNENADINDSECWYEANPSLGYILTERAIRSEIKGGDDEVLDFRIQRLGIWMSRNLKSIISENEWNYLQVDKLPKLKGKIYAGVKFCNDKEHVSMSIAVKCKDSEDIFVECIDSRNVKQGNKWIIDFLSAADIDTVVVDGENGQQLLAEEMKKNHLKKPLIPKVSQVIMAHTKFEQGLNECTIKHGNQPSVLQCVSNTEKRAIGSKGGWGYDTIREGIDISILDSIVLAYWCCSVSKDKKKQEISY